MIRRLTAVIFGIVFAIIGAATVFADQTVHLVVNDQDVTDKISAIEIKEGITFVPFRALSLIDSNIVIEWNPNTKTVSYGFDGMDGAINHTVGTDYYTYNSSDYAIKSEIGTNSYISDGRTMIPIRMLSELGYNITWDGNSKTVYLDSSKP